MTLRLNGSASGYVELDCPAVGGNNNIKLPASNGSANNLLKNSGTAGTLEFASNVNIDSSGRLLVGTSTAPSAGDGQFDLAVVQGNTSGATGHGSISIQRGEAATSITSGEDIGYIKFNDSSGNSFAQIRCTADANAGSGDYPGRLTFSVTADGSASPTEALRIKQNGKLLSVPTYNSTVAQAANVNIQSDGEIYRATSSIKYKTDVQTLEDSYADAILNCRPVWYRSKCEADNPEWGWWGFIAEEVAAIDPRLVHWKTVQVTYDEKGSAVSTPCEPEPEGVQYDRFVPHLLNLIKRQGEAIAELQAEVAALKAS